MAITVFKYGERYHVAVSPPHAPYWRSSEPLTATEILQQLSGMGCHSTDITDALYEADPGWAAMHNAQVLHRRAEGRDASAKSKPDYVRATAVAWVDDEPIPGLVRVEMTDAYGRIWTLIDKTAMFVGATLLRDTTYPVEILLTCDVLGPTGSDGDLLLISTGRFGVETTDGRSDFVVRPSQVTTTTD